MLILQYTRTEEESLVSNLGLPTAPWIRTNATANVFITHFAHGNHAGGKTMMTTHLVRYAQSVDETGDPFRLSVRDVPTSCSEVVFFSAEGNHTDGTPLAFSRTGAYTTVVVPRLAVYGIVAFMSPHERSVRTQAALARRTLNRVTIASRGYGQDPSSVGAVRADTEALLARVQGNTSTTGTAEDYRTLQPLLNASVRSLTSRLEALTSSVEQTINTSMVAPFAVEAVRRFSFGRGYEELPATPGWMKASGGSRWNETVGFGFRQNGSWIYARDNDDHTGREGPEADFLHESSLVSNEVAVFRVGGLAPSQSFVITVITGNVMHYSETAHTAVLGQDGSGFLADKTAAGYWQHRALTVNSSAQGRIDLRFGSNNTGALYQTQDNALYDSSKALSPAGQGPGASFVSWMVAGLLVQTLDQAPTPQATAQLLENTALAKGALRHWTVAGPIYDPEKRGLGQQSPVELDPNQTSYAGIGWGGNAVAWRKLPPPTGTMIELSLASIFEPSHLNSSIAFTKARISNNDKERRVNLAYSASQAATIFLNGVAVDTKTTAAGCMKRDGLVEVTLPAGESEIMMKMSCHWGRAWEFWAGLYVLGDMYHPAAGLREIRLKTEDEVRLKQTDGSETKVMLKSDECAASDANLLHWRQMLCSSLTQGNTSWCGTYRENGASTDWPSQANYQNQILAGLTSAATCLNTSVARDTVSWLDTMQTATAATTGDFFWTWLVFQVQYYDMPRKAGDRIEAPDTLGRKCWAFAFLRSKFREANLTRVLREHGLQMPRFVANYSSAIPFTMSLCDRVCANCFLNTSYDPAKHNSTCPGKLAEFNLGFERENLKPQKGRSRIACPWKSDDGLRDHSIAGPIDSPPVYLDGSDWVATHHPGPEPGPQLVPSVTGYTSLPGLLPVDRANYTGTASSSVAKCGQLCDSKGSAACVGFTITGGTTNPPTKTCWFYKSVPSLVKPAIWIVGLAYYAKRSLPTPPHPPPPPAPLPLPRSINTTIPGDIISDLQRAGSVHDPYFNTNWSQPDFVEAWNSGTWTYSKVFVADPATQGGQLLLVFDGVRMGSMVYLNGVLLGNTTNAFRRYVFTLASSALHYTKPNNISIAFGEVLGIATDGRYTHSNQIDWTPSMPTSDPTSGDPQRPPWGPRATFGFAVWKSVYLLPLTSKSACITHFVPHTFYAGAHPTSMLRVPHAGFEVQAGVELFCPGSEDCSGKASFVGGWPNSKLVSSALVSVPAGQYLTINLTVPHTETENVKLWNPRGNGDQARYNVTATFTPALGDGDSATAAATASTSRLIGFRHVALVTVDDTDPAVLAALKAANATHTGGWTMMFRVNGCAIYSRGGNMVPMDLMEGRFTAEAHRRLVHSAAEAHFTMIRVWGGAIYLPSAFYSAASEFGILIYHDLQYNRDEGDVGNTTDQRHEIGHQIRRLSHHPSIAAWNGGNEMYSSGHKVEAPLDTALDEVLTQVALYDKSRPVWPASPGCGWRSGVDPLSSRPCTAALCAADATGAFPPLVSIPNSSE